ncbi:hypothetical protein A8C32_05930 [Flavivirga aquatica]|uniref:Uncharacterized protein n=1 Tax=Flavivirga aquatica TaxID=1849968 RepID=A0A1E5SHZ6_9FLAO|nr:hypothetical protein [Flavivirga aquatica]OEJ98734.1 hypothetical protein A8C32_05930 [Flavivirga aquatica]
METKASFTWTLKAYEDQGNLFLKWHTDAPFRAQQGQIHVYKGNSFPSDPKKDTKAWTWDDKNNPWNTKLPWGTGWHCAWIAEKPSNGPYTYVVKIVTDKSMGPNVLKDIAIQDFA